MIIAALALDRLNDNGADVDPPLVDEVPDLAFHVHTSIFRCRNRSAKPM
jgi:hypothetical protein